MSTPLSESAFHALVDRTQAALERAIDASGADIDYDSAGGVLTLEFPNRSKLILTRPPPLRQLWVAARSGGFHYDWNGAAWVHDQGGEALATMLTRFIREQSGENLDISL